MEDLIYRFLLQSGFPRASIIFDMDLLGNALPVADWMHRPSFVIVDPGTAELLAVIDVVDAVDAESLRETAIATGAFASRLDGRKIQGFVIRVDVRGRTEEEQVQFYRIWPNSTLQQLSSKSFPDLETLRVTRKLVSGSETAESPTTSESESRTVMAMDEAQSNPREPRPGPGLYFPALALVVLVVLESFVNASRGTSLLTLTQGILLAGAALLLSLPAALRYLRR